MRITEEQINAAIDTIVDTLDEDGLTIDVSSVRSGDNVVLTVGVDAGEDYALAHAPEFAANMAEAEAEIAVGVAGTPLAEAFEA